MRSLTALWRDRRGASAVEFALIAPILASVLVLGWDGWMATRQAMDMRAALSTGARYYQIGGGDDVNARDAALAAWQRRPANGTLTVTRACRCGTTPAACSDICSGNTPPSAFITLVASSSFTGAVQQRTLTETQVVRVR